MDLMQELKDKYSAVVGRQMDRTALDLFNVFMREEMRPIVKKIIREYDFDEGKLLGNRDA